MQRNFIGYANNIPTIIWPHQAKLAISFVLNYEEGSERNILDGDPQAEDLFVDIPGLNIQPQTRHLSSESMFEYGSRVGIWRLIHLFDSYQIPLTFFATGLALARNPVLCHYLKNSSHEIAGHGYRWIDYRTISIEQEREHISKTIDIIQKETNKSVYGWYTGRASCHTRQLLNEFNIQYDSQSYADDLPYWINNHGNPLLVIPYNLHLNDIRYTTSPGWGCPSQAFTTLQYAFDCLYHESIPTLLTVGLHARISGRPERAQALKQFIEYTRNFSVFFCCRYQIAQLWRTQHPWKKE